MVGQNKDDAADQLRSEGLRVVLTQRDADEPKDQVVEMQPPGRHRGRRRLEGDPVLVRRARAGARRGRQDRGRGHPADRGRRLQGQPGTDSATKAKKGTVLQQSPSAGQTLDKGSTVTIVVSTYEEPKPSPRRAATAVGVALAVGPSP